MKRLILTFLALPSFIASTAFAQEYVAIEMEIESINPPQKSGPKSEATATSVNGLASHARSLQVMAL